ncbi:MAG TPA: TonB-dependent receptor, partial [Polyangiaceae bacterium]|nr:TonB-dependent receptor [Polyangiaceae bacterium]
MSKLHRAASVVLAVLLKVASTRAEDAVELTPPVAQSSTDVAYPAGADGDAAVVLELVIEKDGSVSSASVVEGEPPFAEQARTAALAWRFAPARRGDVPVAARIRTQVAFHREEELPAVAAPIEPRPVPATSLPSSALPSAPEPMVEVTVLGSRREIGQTTLSKSDVRQMPGAFGDAFRAIEALPGVAPVASGLPYFYVRGAPPNNAGYYLDGIRIPFLFHLGLGQSVVHPGLIDHVDFFSSAAPARYGGYAGANIAGQTREPARELHGEANLRLVDAGALLEAPFAEGRGSALVAGRYGYPGPIIGALNNDLKIGYWDYQARTSYELGARDTLGIFAFGAHDYVASRSPSGDPEARKKLVEQLVSDFHRLDLRYDHALTDGHVRLALTGGYDSQGAEPTYITDKSLGARLFVEQRFGQSLRFRAGTEARLDQYRIRITRQGPGEPTVPQSANRPPTNLSAGLHFDLVWRIAPRVEIVPGARFDVYASSRLEEAPSTRHVRTILPAADPRLSVRVSLTEKVTWLASFGLAHQYPSLRVGDIPAAIVSVPGFPFGDRKLQSAAQSSQGIEIALPAELAFSATGFYSYFWGLTDLSASCFQLEPEMRERPTTPEPIVPPYVCPNNEPVTGRAYGIELMLRRPFSKRLSGALSYTLSRTTRRAHFLTPSGTEDITTVPSEFDRTHVFNAVLGYELGRRWRIGGRMLFYSGTPYSKLSGSLAVPPYNAYRNPAFYRLD